MTGEFAELLAQVIPVFILALVLDMRARMRDAFAFFMRQKEALEIYQQHLSASGQQGTPHVGATDKHLKDANAAAWYVAKLFFGQSITLIILGVSE